MALEWVRREVTAVFTRAGRAESGEGVGYTGFGAGDPESHLSWGVVSGETESNARSLSA